MDPTEVGWEETKLDVFDMREISPKLWKIWKTVGYLWFMEHV